jgi:hypothetical protein
LRAVAVHDDGDLSGPADQSVVRSLPALIDLQPRELRPDGGDQQERDHAGEQIDRRNQVQFGVERLAVAARIDGQPRGPRQCGDGEARPRVSGYVEKDTVPPLGSRPVVSAIIDPVRPSSRSVC